MRMGEGERERERERGERIRRAYEWISRRGAAKITIGFHVPRTPRARRIRMHALLTRVHTNPLFTFRHAKKMATRDPPVTQFRVDRNEKNIYVYIHLYCYSFF